MYKIPEQISAKLCLKSVLGHLTHTKFEIVQVAGRLKVAGMSNDLLCVWNWPCSTKNWPVLIG